MKYAVVRRWKEEHPLREEQVEVLNVYWTEDAAREEAWFEYQDDPAPDKAEFYSIVVEPTLYLITVNGERV